MISQGDVKGNVDGKWLGVVFPTFQYPVSCILLPPPKSSLKTIEFPPKLAYLLLFQVSMRKYNNISGFPYSRE
jgi:hypothetical protein